MPIDTTTAIDCPQRLAGPSRPPTLAPGLGLVLVGGLSAIALGRLVPAVSTLVWAVVLGGLIGNVGVATERTAPGLTFAAKRLLRAGVVLLGLRLSIGHVLDLGMQALMVVAATVGVTFFGTQWLGRRLGVSPSLSLLVATGYSICGASAIAAVENSTDADEEEVAAAIGLVTLFGSLAIVVLPTLAPVVGLFDADFGTWVGASVHDVAQVVATASTGGSEVVAVAIAVKLTRVVLLAPIVAGVNLQRRAKSRNEFVADSPRPPILPGFVLGFLGMIVLRSSGLVPVGAVDMVRLVEGWLLTAALVGLGSGVRISGLRRLGFRPLLLGGLAWIVVAGISWIGVTLTSL